MLRLTVYQWHGPQIYHETAERVSAKGSYTSVFIQTPSVGRVLQDPYEDSVYIKAKILDELDGNKRDVVLVVHSYGGLAGTNACQGLAKKDREGKETSVIGVVYLCVS